MHEEQVEDEQTREHGERIYGTTFKVSTLLSTEGKSPTARVGRHHSGRNPSGGALASPLASVDSHIYPSGSCGTCPDHCRHSSKRRSFTDGLSESRSKEPPALCFPFRGKYGQCLQYDLKHSRCRYPRNSCGPWSAGHS